MTGLNSVATATKRRVRQAGLTLAETLLVLAIGALAIVGGTLLYLPATAGKAQRPYIKKEYRKPAFP